jgi:hypothetical protein
MPDYMTDSQINNDAIYSLDPGIRYRRIFDEAVLIHQNKAESVVLNESAISFLELCNGQRTLKAIREDLLQQYDTTPDELSADLHDFIQELCDSDIIHVKPETSGI